jgi:hypothetical protein
MFLNLFLWQKDKIVEERKKSQKSRKNKSYGEIPNTSTGTTLVMRFSLYFLNVYEGILGTLEASYYWSCPHGRGHG